MAETLVVIGGIASISQLLDLTAKASNELYTCFHSIRNAGKDMQRQLSDPLKISNFI